MKLNKIKDVLDSKGISQTWLAKQLGKSFSTVNCYARNKYQPDLETLLEISNILEVDLKDLISNSQTNQFVKHRLTNLRYHFILTYHGFTMNAYCV